MKNKLLCLLLFISFCTAGQDNPFPYGKVGLVDLNLTFVKDTSAVAVIIKELGRSEIDNVGNHNLLFTYHVKMKILRKEGLDFANIELNLHKQNGQSEQLRDLTASVYNLQNSQVKVTQFSMKNVFTENYKYHDKKKFTLPNVIVGSVIEYEYQIESPFFTLNFWPWEFQNELPKISSEYWATVPANYRYNIALRGPLPLTRNKSEVLKDYFTPGAEKADCVRYKWTMENVPAFVEEEYMTSKKNFLAAIHFELVQVEYFDGRKDKVTKEWVDIDAELRQYEKFGVQLRRGKEVVDNHIGSLIKDESDPLSRAEKIFDFVRGWYQWNDYFGIYSELGIKKAFEEKKGNVADINLTLVAALRFAGLDCDPMILSTRQNGLATDLFPVLSEFNYVVGKLTVGDKSYLLDATDVFLPFGVLPERCLNGKGRVMAKNESYWFEIKPADKFRRLINVQLSIEQNGELKGTVTNTYIGYKAAEIRREIYSHVGPEDFINDKRKKWAEGEINNYSFTNLEEFSKPLVEKLDIKMDAIDLNNGSTFLFNPFVIGGTISKNPFKSSERTYPVDYGAPMEETHVITIGLPDFLDVDELPAKIAVALPNNGGRFIYEVKKEGKQLTITSSLVISKTIFSSTEYHFLKEFYNKAINAYRMDLMLKKKQG
jgi:hypothetical protein